MTNAKVVITIFALAIALLFAGQHHLYGGGGLENDWAVNSGAKGDKGTGTLTMYGEVVDSEDPQGTCVNAEDTEIKMYFFLRLKFDKTEKIYSRVSEDTYCHETDYGEKETVALHQFLNEVAKELKPGTVYDTCTPDPLGIVVPAPLEPCPNILRSFKNPLDSNAEFINDGQPLSIVGPVILKIP